MSFPETGCFRPYYETSLGKAFLGDSLDVLREVADDSISLVMTSPPYALTFKKEYGNVDASEYVRWFLPYGKEFFRVLKPDGSFVLDIGGTWNKGKPTRSLYLYKLLIALCEDAGFHLAQDLYWYNPGALPAPAEWVNVRRIRLKCAVDSVWWLSKTPWPKADNRQVLKEYSKDMLKLIENGYKPKRRPSGHNITPKFDRDHGGAIPPNLIEMGNNDSNGYYLKACKQAGLPIHPARFPRGLPEFFVRFCTDEGDVVVDPFAGSNVTGEAAEYLNRRWMAIELRKEYLDGSKFRFTQPALDLMVR
ncbi:MAG: site-specific DNA-methyltransferase [Chloroflexi bacterium]|nr:site-specific DNA-methyltransferase [Chloroflexota bacterium]